MELQHTLHAVIQASSEYKNLVHAEPSQMPEIGRLVRKAASAFSDGEEHYIRQSSYQTLKANVRSNLKASNLKASLMLGPEVCWKRLRFK
jgi:hypothetical protein